MIDLSQFSNFFNTIITLFLILIVGFIAGKTKIIDEVASKKLSTLIIKVGQPALIIYSLLKMEYSAQNLALGAKTIAFGLIAHVFMSVVAFFAVIKFKNINERKITEFSTIFANTGFLGIPILESLMGEKGAFMGAFFVISFNLTLWTWGIAILARKRDDIKLTPKKLFNYGTIPCIIGILLYFCCKPFFEFPSFVMSGLSYTASICTPISMLIIGALLARRSLKQTFGSGKLYYLCVLRLIAIPLIVAGILKLIGLEDWILFAATVTAMPSATSVSMLAELYDISPEYSAQAVGITSLFSVVTMPCVVFIAQKLVEM